MGSSFSVAGLSLFGVCVTWLEKAWRVVGWDCCILCSSSILFYSDGVTFHDKWLGHSG